MASPALTVWLSAPDPVQSGALQQVRSELELAGIAIETDLAAVPFGVMLLGEAAFSEACDSPCVLPSLPGQLWGHMVLVLVACATAPPATQTLACLHAGAADVLWWPPDGSSAPAMLARLQRWHAVQQLEQSPAIANCMAGHSRPWRALVREVVEVAAFTESPVLITGETGTGKDVIAHLIHALGGSETELTILDCTTLSPELSGSELFGHEKGAFTGAVCARDGAFAQADGGTLFLDEVGELPLPLQAQLLRAIQERKYKRVGGNNWQSTQFRLICATNRELEAEVARGAFRADLYYRIAGWRCRPPPLRERRADILPLAQHFLRQLAPRKQAPELDPAVREYLLTRDYPGNVRDLRQAVALLWHRHCGQGPITAGSIPPDERQQPSGAGSWPDSAFDAAIQQALALGHGLSRISQAAADTAIRIVLEQEHGSNQRAAQRLGVTDRALQIRRKAQAPSP
jgi:transcriptional regulator with GAF, ATPase, and Fis domain